MTGSTEARPPFTVNDIEVGVRVVDALVHCARSLRGMPITYGDLLAAARQLHPKDAVLDRAVVVGLGMKLRFVAEFCRAHGYPDLSSLAVNRATMRPGPDYQGDWEADRRAAAQFDWSGAQARLAAFAESARAAVPARLKPRKERPADVSWYAYFCSHRAACEKVTPQDKQEIINLMMAGLDPETSLKRVLDAKADFGDGA
ncbi:hypothetical protein [Massilia sp. H6]|uniref:hypothetical protein n=1 Tax=Massilia sp. H6 TaxID=2970464 RepID=UPI00216A94A2|nr:hypothetical protein [Massilia sp. H6]UVW27235.1 hypothetical protein NRS07_11730 [Massilia sp. H6]